MKSSISSDANPSGVQGVCPSGWHVPSNAEWTQLTSYVGSQSEYTCNNNSSNIAKALSSTSGWVSTTNTCEVGNNQSENNASGFSAFPVGTCINTTYLENEGTTVIFWSSTAVSSDVYSAYATWWNNNASAINQDSNGKAGGFSVRCVKN